MARNFCITVFDEIDAENMKNSDIFSYLVMGIETCPSTKKKHYQTYGELVKQIRWNTLYTMFPKTNFRTKEGYMSRKGSPKDASNYCKKGEQSHEEWKEHKEKGPNWGKNYVEFVERGELPKDNRGKKRKKVALEPWCPEIELYWWQKQLLDWLSEPPDRRIFWIYSESGKTGKTTFGKYLTKHKQAMVLNGTVRDVQHGVASWVEANQKWVDVPVVYNMPRNYDMKNFSYEGMENVKDQFFYSGKYEGKAICGPPIHLVVFSNKGPDESKLSADRWEILDIDVDLGDSYRPYPKMIKYSCDSDTDE